LSVHLSNGDGTYRDGNQEVFGELVPSLGGASRKYDTGDFNGDGRVDFAFAMNSRMVGVGVLGSIPEHLQQLFCQRMTRSMRW